MSTPDDIIGVARDHRWMRLSEQQAQLKAAGSRVVVVMGDGAGRDRGKRAPLTVKDLARLVRPGTVVKLMYAFLLADPSKKRPLADFESALALIVDEREGVVADVLTGLSTETKEKRRALVAAIKDQVRRSRQGLRSEENGTRSRGRPRLWFDAERRQIVWNEWHSSAHATNTEAANEASKRIGQRITHFTMWRIVKEMRKERGLKGLGASGRRPNSAAAALAATVGKPSDDRPLPKARVRRGVVYFGRNGVSNHVKIGFSEDHKRRFASLQGASPEQIMLIGTIPGTRKTEMAMHKKFDAQRIHPRREWFRIEGELAKFLKVTFPKFKAER